MHLISHLGTHWADLFFLCGFLILVTPFLGNYLYRVFTGQRTLLHPFLSWAEQGTYRLLAINPHEEMNAWTYARNLGLFQLISLIMLMTLLLLQEWVFPHTIPLTPLSLSLAFNIAVSFITNTNWQSYTPETTLTNGVQMVGLMVQQFLSPAVGLAATLVLLRGVASKGQALLGNFWADIVRCLLYLLLPLSLLLAGFLLHQGSIATFKDSIEYTTMEGNTEKVILGPIAAQTAIMQLGTNGGGFFQANSAHPFSNPSDSSNVLLVVAILLIPAALPHLYGEIIGNRKEGWLIFILMLTLWLSGTLLAEWSQQRENPFYLQLSVIEGQETRIGNFASTLWGTSTTAAANGSVNSSLDSFAPMTGGVLLTHLLLGETLFGGVGVGLASMLFFVLITLFLAGLMIGRSAEYQGKKISQRHMQWVMFALLLPSALILLASSLCIVFSSWFQTAAENPATGPHSFTALIYAVTSCVMNNGSAFSSFTSNTTGYNLLFGLLMLLGRTSVLLPALMLGGLLSTQMPLPKTAGSFSTTTPLFCFMLASILLLYALLSFFPCWILGPFSEQILLDHGQLW